MTYNPTTIYDEEGMEIQLPTHWIICHNCRGEGKHVNPSIDGNGLDPHDPDLDEDFWECYWGGCYDIPCSDCDGTGKVKTVDEDRCTPEQLTALHEQIQDYYEGEQISRMERMMGA